MRTIKRLSMTLLTLVMLIVCFSASTLTAQAYASKYTCRECGPCEGPTGTPNSSNAPCNRCGHSMWNHTLTLHTVTVCTLCGKTLAVSATMGVPMDQRRPIYTTCAAAGFTDCQAHQHSYGPTSWGQWS